MRPTSQNGGLTTISDKSAETITKARKKLNDYKDKLKSGSHTISVDGKSLPTSSLIKSAEGDLEKALNDGKLYLTTLGLNTMIRAFEQGFTISIRDGYHYYLRPNEKQKLEDAKARFNTNLATEDGQEKANAIDRKHMQVGKVTSQSHGISISDGTSHLTTTTTRKSPLGNNKLLELATS